MTVGDLHFVILDHRDMDDHILDHRNMYGLILIAGITTPLPLGEGTTQGQTHPEAEGTVNGRILTRLHLMDQGVVAQVGVTAKASVTRGNLWARGLYLDHDERNYYVRSLDV